MTSHGWTPERTGPLTIDERLALARFLEAFPRPISLVRWLMDTREDRGPARERIGECELEMRGWLRYRRRRRRGLVIEITRRAEREFPAILDPGARRCFISETRASLLQVPEERRGGMEPDAILLACGRVAMQRFVDAAPDDGRRRRAAAIFDRMVHLAGDTGQALCEALAHGFDTRARDLVGEVLGVVGEAALRTVLRQQQAEDLLDGVPVTVLH